MLRLLVAAIISPWVFPLIGWPATNSAFRLLTGEFSWYWDFPSMSLNFSTYLLFGYVQMVVIVLPIVLLARSKGWASWWMYVLGGFVIGHLTFFIVSLLMSPDMTHDTIVDFYREPTLLINILWAGEIVHYQLGIAFASGIAAGIFWLTGIRNNSWYLPQGNKSKNDK